MIQLILDMKASGNTLKEIVHNLLPHPAIYTALDSNEKDVSSLIQKIINKESINAGKRGTLFKKLCVVRLYQFDRDLSPRKINHGLNNLCNTLKQDYTPFIYRHGKELKHKLDIHWNVDLLSDEEKKFEYVNETKQAEFEVYEEGSTYNQKYVELCYIHKTDCSDIAGQYIRYNHDKIVERYPQSATFMRNVHKTLNETFDITIIDFKQSVTKTAQTNFKNNFIFFDGERHKYLNKFSHCIAKHQTVKVSNLQSVLNLVDNKDLSNAAIARRQVYIHFGFDKQNGIKSTATEPYPQCINSDVIIPFTTTTEYYQTDVFIQEHVYKFSDDEIKSKLCHVSECVKQELVQCKTNRFELGGERCDAFEYEIYYEQEYVEIQRGIYNNVKHPDQHKLHKTYIKKTYYLKDFHEEHPKIIEFKDRTEPEYVQSWKEYQKTGKLFVGLASYHHSVDPQREKKYWRLAQSIFDLKNKNLDLEKYPFTIQLIEHKYKCRKTGKTLTGKTKYKKGFFGARYCWRKDDLLVACLAIAQGIRTDVCPPPDGLVEIMQHFKDIQIIPASMNVNLYAVNYYLKGLHGLGSHKDDKFCKTVYTYSLGSDSRLSFEKTCSDNGMAMFGIDLPKGTVLEMKLDSFAGDICRHMVARESLARSRACVIFREVSQRVLNKARRYTESEKGRQENHA